MDIEQPMNDPMSPRRMRQLRQLLEVGRQMRDLHDLLAILDGRVRGPEAISILREKRGGILLERAGVKPQVTGG